MGRKGSRCPRQVDPLPGEGASCKWVSSSEEYGWPYSHTANKIYSKTWDRLRMLLIGYPKVGPRYEKEPTLENRHQPTHYLDARTSVLESRLLNRRRWSRALVEQEIFGQMQQVEASYFKL
ncbi:uncharacterized protein A4U43_UnF7910 [Asparagus officinalis]|uniref:Uncharacterized protein n=1 Tax=Asparagus officinalis TaxID=4686 RepID=A0A1R3L624_ASPOF|nr:uncharacterized protein A4U43_UnF7910 [Asparagus officinalis]